MERIKKMLTVFNDLCNLNTINKLSTGKKLRNKKNGLTIFDCLYYRFLYAAKNSTKGDVAAHINKMTNKIISREAYYGKENNIPLEFYELLFNSIVACYNSSNNSEEDIFVAVDGIHNNDNKRNVLTNLGLFSVTSDVPLSINFGNKRNSEIKMITEHIKSRLEEFKNVIFICDRGYFSYEFLNFLESNNLRYIIRAKGNAINLDPNITPDKNVQKRDLINKLRNTVRLVTCKRSYNKIVSSSKSKKKTGTVTIKIKNDWTLVTNLGEQYSDDQLIDLYKRRWDIEVFFKFIKNNFKFQLMDEKFDTSYKKMYLCDLILTYIMKFIEDYYWEINKKPKKTIKKRSGKTVECTVKINKTLLMRGIFDSLLYEIITNKLTKDNLDKFSKICVKINKNEINRSFPRTSKTPFSKWYIKGYSEATKMSKIIKAIINDKIDSLNKNLKTIANKIIMINGKQYG
jgi:hypothetical protein